MNLESELALTNLVIRMDIKKSTGSRNAKGKSKDSRDEAKPKRSTWRWGVREALIFMIMGSSGVPKWMSSVFSITAFDFSSNRVKTRFHSSTLVFHHCFESSSRYIAAICAVSLLAQTLHRQLVAAVGEVGSRADKKEAKHVLKNYPHDMGVVEAEA
ncbi:hypothetical protein ACLOJK_007520 [Asimina triloba]